MRQRVLVCGGRDYRDWESAYKVLDAAHYANPIECLIHGAARGADSIAADWAESRLVPIEPYPADWKRDGRGGGPVRNQRMLDEGKPHMVIAFPGGAGTADMVKRAEKAGIPVVKITKAIVERCS